MSRPDNVTYRISTLRDFWELGDADRIDRAFKEIALGMSQARRLMDLMESASEALGHNAKFPVAWPESIEWVDDGGKEVGFRLLDDRGETLIGMKHHLSEGFHKQAEEEE